MATPTGRTATSMRDDDDEGLISLLSEQRQELVAAQNVESDMHYAFELQLQEALDASLALTPSTSFSPPPPPLPPQPQPQSSPSTDTISFPALQFSELKKLEQEIDDRKQFELEMRRVKEDLQRCVHDQRVAREILRIPEHEWREWGDNFEQPFGEGSSTSDDNVFRLYSKGLLGEETVIGEKTVLGGIGVAICDPQNNLVFELRKPLNSYGMNKTTAEFKALIEGLDAALALELKRIVIHCDCFPLFQFIIGRWPPKQRKIAMLVNQVSLLQKKFLDCNTTLVARNVMTFTFKLAREAILSQVTMSTESGRRKTPNETCVICLEDADAEHIFSVDGCQHRYCFSCMKQHVEVKLLHGMVPKCPHVDCKAELNVDSCGKFLTSKLIKVMRQRIKEASIPVTERVYCPYPRCSALMSKKEIFALEGIAGAGRCTECSRLFCINCKVPWHNNMTCDIYKRLNPNPPEDMKLKSLATRNLWRQCVKCNHMIELAEGCYHMTCRCGYEFCYTCGAEWKNKKSTCSCPLWDEDHILYDDDDDGDSDEDGDDEYYESDSDDY
ncbi:hypothetical protein K2173_023656 [Erythroxylum novogranatense]|uniref:RBR-type E3 ubiquitin transferase n=1 Tax=Erythroxylum novogranatense TaxID=1862640 RepID=A0AAV8TPE4_9ROSI|nr:hypothetical protein K2173_023656 [Erythroxylum novogranatense]